MTQNQHLSIYYDFKKQKGMYKDAYKSFPSKDRIFLDLIETYENKHGSIIEYMMDKLGIERRLI